MTRKTFIFLAVFVFCFNCGGFCLSIPGVSDVAGQAFKELGSDIPVRVRVDLSSGDADAIGVSILEKIEKISKGKIIFWCVPKTRKEAIAAMTLGFVTPRNKEDLVKVHEMGFGKTVSIEDMVELAALEYKIRGGIDRKKVSKVYIREKEKFEINLSKVMTVRGKNFDRFVVVTNSKRATNHVGNGDYKNNIGEFKQGIDDLCILYNKMVLKDENCLLTLAGALGVDKLDAKVCSVENACKSMKTNEKSVTVRRKIPKVVRTGEEMGQDNGENAWPIFESLIRGVVREGCYDEAWESVKKVARTSKLYRGKCDGLLVEIRKSAEKRNPCWLPRDERAHFVETCRRFMNDSDKLEKLESAWMRVILEKGGESFFFKRKGVVKKLKADAEELKNIVLNLSDHVWAKVHHSMREIASIAKPLLLIPRTQADFGVFVDKYIEMLNIPPDKDSDLQARAILMNCMCIAVGDWCVEVEEGTGELQHLFELNETFLRTAGNRLPLRSM